ncbi:MAG: hypothetical protein IPH59_10630 [bacterium]|nr:hypothetical protein [bacterium]
METSFNKSADTSHQITLQSSLVYAVWLSGTAQAGREVYLEVGTSFVGLGAAIEIKVKSQDGKNLGSLNEKIYNNKFVGKVLIAGDAKIGDMAYFEVKLPALSLQGESNRISIVPPIKVKNMSWSASEARRGDVLTLKADIENVDEEVPAKVIIFEADQDGAHDRICEIQTIVKNSKITLDWEYEYHEDTDEIPTEEELQRYGRGYNPPEYFFVIEIDKQEFGREQDSGLLTFKDSLEIQANQGDGAVMANEDIIAYLADGTEKRATLDEYGYAKLEGIPPGKCRIEFPNRDGMRPMEFE